MTEPDSVQAPRSGMPGALLLLVPITVAAATLAWLQGRRPTGQPHPEPPPSGEVLEIVAWAGGTGASGVSAALTRLHPEPTRQSFDSRALASRLGLEAGEPWRLELHQAGDAPLALESPLEVLAGGEVILRSMPRVPEQAGPADPVAVLTSPPQEVDAGGAVSLLLWGEEPPAEALLRCGSLELELTRELQRRAPGATPPDGDPDARLEGDGR